MSKKNAFSVLMESAKSPPKSQPPTKKRKLESVGTLNSTQKSTLKEKLTIPYKTYSNRIEYEEFYQNTMAPFLLNQVELIAGGERLLLREIEFYFTSSTHPDPFTHCQPLQEQSLIWYFHRTGSSYKSGTYKGLDIAIGQGSEAPGGILIRTIEELSTGKIICGPCNSVDHILKLCGASTIHSLVEDQMKGDISVFGGDCNKLYLYPLDSPNNDQIIHTGRVGLYMTKKTVPVEVQADYVFRNYRSVAEPKKVWKGRHLMGLALLYDGKTVEEIEKITGLKKAVILRYEAGYKEGLSKPKDLSVYAKRINDSIACTCFGTIVTKIYNKKEETEKVEEVEESEESEEVELSEESLDYETIPDISTNIDLNSIIPWMRWKVQETLKNVTTRTKNVSVLFYPFPHDFSKNYSENF